MLYSTVPEIALGKIISERGMPHELIAKSSRYVNAVEEVPNKNIPVEMHPCTREDYLNKAAKYVRSYIENSTNGGKAVFSFGSIANMNSVYDKVKDLGEAVVQISAQSSEREKVEVFGQFESINSKTRVILGTKLISNGLDCPSVDFVCLVGLYLNPFDYLQMIGRLRREGVVKVLTPPWKFRKPSTDEVTQVVGEIKWDKCITEQIVAFHDVEYTGHMMCCGYNKDRYTENIHRILTVLNGDVEEPDQELSDDDVIEISDPQTDPVINMFDDGSPIDVYDLKSAVGIDWGAFVPYRKLLLDVDPHKVVQEFYDPPGKLCGECLFLKESCGCLEKYGSKAGMLICQLLITYKILGNKEVEVYLNDRGGRDVLEKYILQENDKTEAVVNKALSTVCRGHLRIGICGKRMNNVAKAFSYTWQKLIDQKVNLLDYIMKGECRFAPHLYEKPSEYLANVLGDRDAMKRYRQFYAAGDFSTSTAKMLSSVLGNMDGNDSLDKLIKNPEEKKMLLWFLWCVFLEKQHLGGFLKCVDCDIDDACLSIFPIFVKTCLAPASYNGQSVPMFVMLFKFVVKL